jgi:hypothetical protein
VARRPPQRAGDLEDEQATSKASTGPDPLHPDEGDDAGDLFVVSDFHALIFPGCSGQPRPR